MELLSLGSNTLPQPVGSLPYAAHLSQCHTLLLQQSKAVYAKFPLELNTDANLKRIKL